MSAYILSWMYDVHSQAKNLRMQNRLRITRNKGLSFFIVLFNETVPYDGRKDNEYV